MSLSSCRYLEGTYALKLEALLRCMCKELEKTVLPLTGLQFCNQAECAQCHHAWAKSSGNFERRYY